MSKQPAQEPNQPISMPANINNELASSHEDVTILFTDIVGFTSLSKAVKPDQVMAYLNELFTAFDALVDTYQIYKVRSPCACVRVRGGRCSMPPAIACHLLRPLPSCMPHPCQLARVGRHLPGLLRHVHGVLVHVCVYVCVRARRRGV